MINDLIDIIESEGIILEDRNNVYNSLERSVNSGCFKYIYHNNIRIGFLTWNYNNDNLFVNNFIIYKKYKGSFNISTLRKFFRNKYPNIKCSYWINIKKNKPVEFNEKRTAICI